jgi:hypothetical protein
MSARTRNKIETKEAKLARRKMKLEKRERDSWCKFISEQGWVGLSMCYWEAVVAAKCPHSQYKNIGKYRSTDMYVPRWVIDAILAWNNNYVSAFHLEDFLKKMMGT